MRLAFIFTVVILSSCKHQTLKFRHNIVKLKLPASFVNVLHDSLTNHFYSYDLRTRKEIRFFGENGQLKETVYLREILDSIPYDFYSAGVVNPQEIVLLGDGNQFLIVDHKGNFVKRLDLRDDYFKGKKMMGIPQVLNGYIFIGVAGIPKPGQKKFTNPIKAGNYYHSIPTFAKISIKTSRVQFFGDNLIKRFLPRNCVNPGFVYFEPLNSKNVIYNSILTDTVYQVSTDNKICPVMKVTDGNEKIGCPPFTQEQFLSQTNWGKQHFTSYASISSVLKDKSNKHWYVIIRKPKINEDELLPIDILAYDFNWKLIAKKSLASNTYKMIYFLTDQGLMIQRNTKDQNVKIFDCLQLVNE